jgi:alkyl sulfatase BDS1-like metallo-beta-lactamase superfamily hydrolase
MAVEIEQIDRSAKPAEPMVQAKNSDLYSKLPFSDRQDFEDADRGFIATLPDASVTDASGRVVWSQKPYEFLKAEQAPDTVNPSLWRQAQLNCRHGLYEVVPGLYQVRGFDISSMTIIEGDTGVIIVDPLVTAQVAKAGLELYYKHRSQRAVHAVIYTHSHTDHWGGVKGVTSVADVEAGKTVVIAPEGFLEAIASENILAGPAMIRRSQYQFGQLLPKGERGQVDAGLGKTVSTGAVTLIPPTDLIRADHEKRVVDGVEIIFLMAPNSEAPAEFHMFYPRYRTLNMAENACHNFHNLLPFRGAQVRDAKSWSRYIDVALAAFGEESDALIAQHHWPVWGRDRVKDYLRTQRDLYKYVHDQTLRLMNLGYTPQEIAESVELPDSICCQWHARGYYGSVRHNVKAVYQYYLGWYDANPAHLDPLPPVDAGKKYVEYMGGADAVVANARKDFSAGNYRWVVEALKHVVFADPSNAAARELQADAYEQLSYLAEAATWRNAYQMAAYELRNGPPKRANRNVVAPDALRALSLDALFDFWAVRVNGPKAAGRRIVLNWRFSDTGQVYVLNIENGAMTHRSGKASDDAQASITLSRKVLEAVVVQETTFADAVRAGRIQIEGDVAKLLEIQSLLDTFDSTFAIVEP